MSDAPQRRASESEIEASRGWKGKWGEGVAARYPRREVHRASLVYPSFKHSKAPPSLGSRASRALQVSVRFHVYAVWPRMESARRGLARGEAEEMETNHAEIETYGEECIMFNF